MAEQLQIVAWKDSWGGYGKWGTTIALTPHAPAQSALDDLRREVEALRADAARYRWLARNFDELWSAFAPEEGSTYNSLDIAIDAAQASTDEGVGK